MTRILKLFSAILLMLAQLLAAPSAGTPGAVQGTPGAAQGVETGAAQGTQTGAEQADGPRQGSAARPSTAGKLAVKGTDLVGEDGQKVQLRGASTHGLAWFPQFVNKALFQEMSEDWGANCVRLALYTAEYGGYCTGGDREALRKLVQDGVSYAAASDMYVIVDWHILSDGDPNTHKAEAVEFFGEMSRALAGFDNVLYEICNEPNSGTTWAQIKSYAGEVIPVIRENAPDAVILVGTPNWSQRVDEAARDPLTGYENIMYTLHFYAATHKDQLRAVLKNAVEAGLPVFVSEYGICDASGSGTVDTAEAARWMELLDRYNISSMMWSLSNKAESASIISSAVNKTSGFTRDDLTQSGKFLLEILSGTASKPAPEGGQTPLEGGSNAPQTTPEDPSEGGQQGGESLNWKLENINSWRSGGKICTQYRLTVSNSGAAPVSTWSVTLALGGEFALVDSWNGVFTAEGGSLTVTPMEYNAAIPAGGSVGDIGFIVEQDP